MLPKFLDDRVRELQSVGFTEYEARIYLALLEHSPATAYELAKHTSIARPNVYGALDALAKKFVVQPISENPARFIPIGPEVLLRRIASETNSRCENLISNLSDIGSSRAAQYVLVLSGEDNIHRKVSEMISLAKIQLCLKATEDFVDFHFDELREAAQRGVVIMMVMFGDNVERFSFGPKVFAKLHEANGRRMGIADHLLTITRDQEEALTADVHGEFLGAYTENRAIVSMAQLAVRHDLYLAEIMSALGDEIDKKFGPNLRDLRRKFYTPTEFSTFHEAMFKATSEEGNGDVAQE